MLGQHLKQLYNAGFIEEVPVKKEVPNKVGKRIVHGYILKIDAFEDLLLEINFFADELLTYLKLSDNNQIYDNESCCKLTIFNGKDKGKTFTVNKDETVMIGRKTVLDNNISESGNILLDNSYTSVSAVSKLHLKLFYNDDNWCILDESSTNGTYILDKKVPTGEITKLRNNTFIKLSKGKGNVIIHHTK